MAVGGDSWPLDTRFVIDPSFAAGVLDAVDSHIAVVEVTGRIVAVNAAWESFAAANGGHGVGPGADYFAACAGASDPSAAQALHGLQQVADGRVGVARLEYPCHGPRERRWFRMTASRAMLAGTPYLVIRHDDITAERLTREAVEHRGELLDSVDLAVVATDLDGVVQLWNEAAQRLWGWSPEQAVPHHLADLLVPVQRRAAARRALAAATARGSWSGTLTLLHRDGRPVTVRARYQLIRDARALPRSATLVALDTGGLTRRSA